MKGLLPCPYIVGVHNYCIFFEAQDQNRQTKNRGVFSANQENNVEIL